MKPTLAPLHVFLFQHIIRLIMATESLPIYSPAFSMTISCGSSTEVEIDPDGRHWVGDVSSKFSPREVGEPGYTSEATKAPPQSSSTSRVPYNTARISRFEFTYRFPIAPGQMLFVRLHFYPASYPNFTHSEAHFFVTVGRYILLKDFNASLFADTEGVETIYKEFCVYNDADDTLDFTFSPSRTSSNSYAFINGIEIVSMPPNLYYNTSESHRLNYEGNKVSYHIENSTALEMVYRINIGGKRLSSMEDTGMYRSWDGNDDMYLDDLSRRFSVIPANTSIQLKFGSIPEYTAPDEVYRTGRSMGMNKTINNKSYNLTWEFPVDSRISYMVRLHFCEFEPEIANNGDRMFQLYIANQTAEKEADIVMWSGGNGIPTYRDYFVFMSDSGGRRKVNLSVSLQANWQTTYPDAILNGLEIFKLFDSNGNNIDLNLDPRPEGTPPPQAQARKIPNKSTPVIAIIAGVLSSMLVFFVLGFLVIKRRWKANDSSSRDRATQSTMNLGSPLPSYFCRYFSLAEIKAATKNFNDTFIIGAGGFGNVYKGCIDGGATPVAIKRLKPESSQGAHEFKTEIEMLSQLRHRHLVSLIGYCAEKGEMILVYDYMACGTLRDHLYHTNNPPLPWEQRLQICIGTARGLQYLHSGAKGTIIHRDVKSTNILLDDKWVAKVSDFGLSKGTNTMSKTHISTVVKGSFGYLDPEYYRRQRLTEKSDVYSLGVLLFEVLCARPAVIQTEELKQVSLAEWAKSCHQNGEIDQIIDPSLRGKIAAECLNKFTEIAISCMHDNGTERPSMTDVVRGLELALQLQQSAEGNINCTEMNVETETSSSEQSCATKDSIKCISATIFSEINNPSGR
ncbi:putative protein kinase RLK-Pelle-CrRLK1L-1 family [Rosa chinensis]|uniref:Protein kinase domain-containing protein n=1 Tax=Rosa chinensis TaxID=74649 RepID=A0A2P6PAD7_ROSCH|nr:receptor-like protein kinase FERONIA [Rosa chinensis]PRQ18882.1 putative protein kinase RLK-Pelle-CrRLK1L-1 family [Rosa chinensis]